MPGKSKTDYNLDVLIHRLATKNGGYVSEVKPGAGENELIITVETSKPKREIFFIIESDKKLTKRQLDALGKLIDGTAFKLPYNNISFLMNIASGEHVDIILDVMKGQNGVFKIEALIPKKGKIELNTKFYGARKDYVALRSVLDCIVSCGTKVV